MYGKADCGSRNNQDPRFHIRNVKIVSLSWEPLLDEDANMQPARLIRLSGKPFQTSRGGLFEKFL